MNIKKTLSIIALMGTLSFTGCNNPMHKNPTITSLKAELQKNSTCQIAITVDNPPTSQPTAMSVDIKRNIDGKADSKFKWNGGTSSWDKDKATLTVTEIPQPNASTKKQDVIYKVAWFKTDEEIDDKTKIPEDAYKETNKLTIPAKTK